MRARGARHVEVTAGKMRRSLLEPVPVTLVARRGKLAIGPDRVAGYQHLAETEGVDHLPRIHRRHPMPHQRSPACAAHGGHSLAQWSTWKTRRPPQPGRIVAVAGEDLMPGLIVIGKRPAFQNGQF